MSKKSKTVSIQEFAGPPEVIKGPYVKGRIVYNLLALGPKSINRNLAYPPTTRQKMAEKLKNRSVFFNHTKEELGEKYYRRAYNELMGTVIESEDTDYGVRFALALSNHKDCDRFLKDIEDGLPVGGFSPEFDGKIEDVDGQETCTDISFVKCLALTSCPGTGHISETEVGPSSTPEDLDEDEGYHKRRAVMIEIEKILMAIKDEEENSDKQKYLKIKEILSSHLGQEEDCEGVKETEEPKVEQAPEVKEEPKEEAISETEAPLVQSPLPGPVVLDTNIEYKRLTPQEIFARCWK